MRSVTGVISPERGAFDPGERILASHGAPILAIHDIDVLEDGTAVMRHEVEGDEEQIHASLADFGEKVIDYQVIPAGDHQMLQVHYHPSDLLVALLGELNRRAVTLDYPLEYVDPPSSRLRVTAVGAADDVRDLLEAARGIVDVSIETVGDYEPASSRVYSDLTERQRQVLRVAVEQGYYADPREGTYEDVARHLDCSPAAVGQHLRRVESELVRSVVPERVVGGSGGAVDG